jgi:hypothetical protein
MTAHQCHKAADCLDAELVTIEHCGADCACHTGPYRPCSEPGGCGHTHETIDSVRGAAIEAVAGLCPTCERITADDIACLPVDYASLCQAAIIGATAGNFSELVASTRELPIPICLTFDTLAEQILCEVTTFVEPVAEALSIDWDAMSSPIRQTRFGPSPRYRKQVVFDMAASLLSGSISTLLTLPVWEYRMWDNGELTEVEVDGLTAALGLAALHRAARCALGLTRYSQRMTASCPGCGSAALVRQAGADGVYCTACRARWSDLDYERQTLVLAAEAPKPGRKRPVPVGPVRYATVEGTVARPANVWRVRG